MLSFTSKFLHHGKALSAKISYTLTGLVYSHVADLLKQLLLVFRGPDVAKIEENSAIILCQKKKVYCEWPQHGYGMYM